MKKRIIAILLSAALILNMTACGSNPAISANAGDIIEFGGYDWQVLDVQDGKALVLSVRVFTSQPYHDDGGKITWENSSIREYLNGSFIDDMFTSEEQERIAETSISNKPNQHYETEGGIDTVDKVFLLSIDEAETYFSDNSSRIALNADDKASRWWLRSPGYISTYVAVVFDVGIVSVYGDFASHIVGGVRPALWLNL
ncbi:MAG: DUF6273 domain-containing protein [Oscillospiraceae bacterium]|nr:DUF6273 domain-containing protein [Oscillospiraceae bacterium]